MEVFDLKWLPKDVAYAQFECPRGQSHIDISADNNDWNISVSWLSFQLEKKVDAIHARGVNVRDDEIGTDHWQLLQEDVFALESNEFASSGRNLIREKLSCRFVIIENCNKRHSHPK